MIKTSSAPYLTEQTGSEFKNRNEMNNGIQYMIKNINNFKPREWILKYGTNKYSSQKLLDLIKNIN